MKKLIAAMLLLALLLTGCAKEEKIVVDTLNHTISQGKTTYTYTDTTKGDTRTIIIRYPNGGIYTWTKSGDDIQANGVDMPQIANGEILVHAILNPNAPEEREDPAVTSLQWFLIVVGILVAIAGVPAILWPSKIWDLFYRRWYREDVSEYAMTRIVSTGFGEIVLGIGIILIAIFA